MSYSGQLIFTLQQYNIVSNPNSKNSVPELALLHCHKHLPHTTTALHHQIRDYRRNYHRIHLRYRHQHSMLQDLGRSAKWRTVVRSSTMRICAIPASGSRRTMLYPLGVHHCVRSVRRSTGIVGFVA